MAVSVTVVGSRAEAELIVGMLASNGVRARVSADDAGGVEAALQSQGVRVLVADGDAARARRLIGEEPVEPKRLNGIQRLLVRVLGGRS